MKALTYSMVILSLFWIDIAYRAVTRPVPLIVRVPISDRAYTAGYVVPVQECGRICRARAKASKVGQ